MLNVKAPQPVTVHIATQNKVFVWRLEWEVVDKSWLCFLVRMVFTTPPGGWFVHTQEHPGQQLWDGNPFVHQRSQSKASGQPSPQRCQMWVSISVFSLLDESLSILSFKSKEHTTNLSYMCNNWNKELVGFRHVYLIYVITCIMVYMMNTYPVYIDS